jgi:hypothetical protein
LSKSETLADRVRACYAEGKTLDLTMAQMKTEFPKKKKSEIAAYVREVWKRSLRASQKVEEESKQETQKLEQTGAELTKLPEAVQNVSSSGGNTFVNISSESPPFSFEPEPEQGATTTGGAITQVSQTGGSMIFFSPDDWIEIIHTLNEKIQTRNSEWALSKGEEKLWSLLIRRYYEKKASVGINEMKVEDLAAIVMLETFGTRIVFYLIDHWTDIAAKFQRGKEKALPAAVNYEKKEATPEGKPQ